MRTTRSGGSASRARRCAQFGGRVRDAANGQIDGHGCARTRCAFDVQGAVMHFRQSPHERETEARALVRAVGAVADLHEGIAQPA